MQGATITITIKFFKKVQNSIKKTYFDQMHNEEETSLPEGFELTLL